MSNSDDEAFDAAEAKRIAKEKRLEELAEVKAEAERRQDKEYAQDVKKKLQELREKAKQREHQLKNGVDSNDDDENVDEAMDGEETSHTPSPEPSDAESIGSANSSEDGEIAEKLGARRFMDLSADESEDEQSRKFVKGIRKKHKKKDADEESDKPNESDKEFIADDGEVEYDSDEEQRIALRKARRRAREGRKDGTQQQPKEPKQRKAGKRKRIAEEEEEEEEEEEDEEAKMEDSNEDNGSSAQMFETDDKTLETMKALTKEAEAGKSKANFHEQSDIAKAAAAKKNQTVDPSSLQLTPKKEKPVKKPKNSPANGGSSKKKTGGAGKAKPTYQTGDRFELNKVTYIVSSRASDFPMRRGPNTALIYDWEFCDVTFFSTCEVLEPVENGEYKKTGKFDSFQLSKEAKPKRAPAKVTLQMWEQFTEKHPSRAKALALESCNNENFRDNRKALVLPPHVFKKVQKECHKENSEWKWTPKPNKSSKENGPPLSSATATPAATQAASSSLSDRLEKAATPPPSAKKAPASGNGKASKKAKITTENGNQDVAKMLQRASAKPAAAAAASSSDPISLVENEVDELVRNIWVEESSKKVDIFIKNREVMTTMLVEFLSCVLLHNPDKEKLKQKYKELSTMWDNVAPGEKPTSKMLKALGTEKNLSPWLAIMYFLPFLSEPAAAAARKIIMSC